MSSWTRFLNEIDENIRILEADGCDIPFFRGQSNSTWNLEPSLFRKKYPNNTESLLYYDFLAYSGPLFSEKLTSWDNLFEMQHSGLPTRLLDWSENFSVALYFALLGEPESPCIWILDPFELNRETWKEPGIANPILDFEFTYFGAYIDLTETSFEHPIAIFPSKQSKRVFAQKGVFTLHGNSKEPLNSLYPVYAKQIKIPKDSIPEARQFLRLAGVDHYSVFPDVDGLAKLLFQKHCKDY